MRTFLLAYPCRDLRVNFAANLRQSKPDGLSMYGGQTGSLPLYPVNIITRPGTWQLDGVMQIPNDIPNPILGTCGAETKYNRHLRHDAKSLPFMNSGSVSCWSTILCTYTAREVRLIFYNSGRMSLTCS